MNIIYKTKELSQECWSNLTDIERSQLLDLIIDNNFTSYLEVGVMRGGNLINMTNLLRLNNKKCEIVGYDCFELLKDCKPKHNTHISGFPRKETVEKNVNTLHNCNVELIMGLSENIDSVFKDRKFDLIFHDADHSHEGVKASEKHPKQKWIYMPSRFKQMYILWGSRSNRRYLQREIL